MNQQYMFQVAYYDKVQLKRDNEDSQAYKDRIRPFNEAVKDYNEKITTKVVYEKTSEQYLFTENSFVMKTSYPGVVIGLGNLHQSGASDEEVKTGFTLDYVTGLPYLPGSSLKGIIRNAFETKVEMDGKTDYLVKQVLEEKGICLSDSEYAALVLEIFGSKPGKKGDNQKGADMFVDAVVIEPTGGKVLGFDYITSHKLSQQDKIGLKNPTPVRILKILPEVQLLFRFRLTDSKVCGDLTAEKKRELFEDLLAFTGIGAKTNTGYGALQKTVSRSTQYYELMPKQLEVQAAQESRQNQGRANNQNRNQNQRQNGYQNHNNGHNRPNNRGGRR